MIELDLKQRDDNGYVLDLKMDLDYIGKLRKMFNLNFINIKLTGLCKTSEEVYSLLEAASGWMHVCKYIKDRKSIEILIPSHCMDVIVNFVKSDSLIKYCKSIGLSEVEDISFIEDFNESINLVA